MENILLPLKIMIIYLNYFFFHGFSFPFSLLRTCTGKTRRVPGKRQMFRTLKDYKRALVQIHDPNVNQVKSEIPNIQSLKATLR